ncbi:MAG TPA: hypothetical protein VIG32_09650 [Candidatus Baltobacteraceae bacterium]|jgi:hypothetical protein
MQGVFIVRSLTALALAAGLAACSSATQSTHPQSNSTAAPDAAMTKMAKTHYRVSADKASKSMNYSVYVNGQPGPTLNTAGGSADISSLVPVGNDTIAIKWKKDRNNGSGTVTVWSGAKVLLVEHVRPSDPVTGQKSVSVSAK